MLVSALIADGPPSRVLEEVADGQIELVVPEFVLGGLERVLTDKLGFELERVHVARSLLERLAVTLPQQPAQVEAVAGDPDDDVILASGVESQAGVLATGDGKHLLPLREHRGVRLLTPQALLAELRAS